LTFVLADQNAAGLISPQSGPCTKAFGNETDGHWEGEGVKAGKKMQFHADPKTGAITSEKPND